MSLMNFFVHCRLVEVEHTDQTAKRQHKAFNIENTKTSLANNFSCIFSLLRCELDEFVFLFLNGTHHTRKPLCFLP